MIPRLLTVLVLALAVAGCGTPTPYRAAGTGNGYGYSEQLIDRTRFRVSFRSNAVTPRETVENNALLRAAELTLAQGGDYFVVASRDVTYDRGGYDDGAYGGVGVGGGSRGVYSGVGIGIPLGMEGPDSRTVSLEIVIHRGAKPANRPDTYDARAVRQALMPG
jgi:hypothetical protein